MMTTRLRPPLRALPDVPPDLLIGAAELHRTPAAAAVLGPVEEQPRTAHAALQPGQPGADEQPVGRGRDRPQGRFELGERPGLVTWRRHVGVTHRLPGVRPEPGPRPGD